MFNLDLLKAVNDWQIGDRNKVDVAIEIRKASASLPEKFKFVSGRVFRKYNLKGSYFKELVENFEIAETYSSWTTSETFAKGFKNKVVYLNGDSPTIFSRKPRKSEVILNLKELFADQRFQDTAENYKPLIENYDRGIGMFGGSEEEVILDVSSVSLNDLHSLGGIPSSKSKIRSILLGTLGSSLTASQEKALDDNYPKSVFWLNSKKSKAVFLSCGKKIPPNTIRQCCCLSFKVFDG